MLKEKEFNKMYFTSVTKSELKRTPASLDNRKMVEFMDTHNFSFSISKDSKKLRSRVTLKK